MLCPGVRQRQGHGWTVSSRTCNGVSGNVRLEYPSRCRYRELWELGVVRLLKMEPLMGDLQLFDGRAHRDLVPIPLRTPFRSQLTSWNVGTNEYTEAALG
jgi:hypothetical protein